MLPETTGELREARSLLEQGHVDEALERVGPLLSRDPSAAEVHHLCGVARLRRREPTLALAHFEHALECGLNPLDVAGEIWTCSMLLGNFENAWRQSDLVLERRRAFGRAFQDQPLHLRHVWDGTPLDGKRVLVRCYHGLGDTIQFIRYASALRQRASRVVVQVERRLIPLLCTVRGIDSLVSLEVPEAEPPYDVDIESMEVPHALRATLKDAPANQSYLCVPTTRIRAARTRMPASTGLKVGVAWSGGEWAPERSVPLADLEVLNTIEGLALYALQTGPTAARIARGSRAPRFIGDDGWCRDLVDTAAMIANLDLVITVDTMIAHLAGAIGVPVWTLLHFESDWRWMVGRDDTPWYPSMRLFRQPTAGDWSTPLAAIVEKLRAEAAHREARIVKTAC
jgi:hypothetical protein